METFENQMLNRMQYNDRSKCCKECSWYVASTRAPQCKKFGDLLVLEIHENGICKHYAYGGGGWKEKSDE